jgi:pimeloyl-ACP methyl ester carboxylesterase
VVSLGGGEEVYVAQTPPAVQSNDKDLVLCVHGMSGAATNWTDLMAELTPEFGCVAVDLPGSGFSPPPKSADGYSVSAMARTVVRLIETLPHPVHLVGNSMGGAVSVKVAATRPELLRSLTLISPALPDRMPRPSLLRFPLLTVPGLGGRVMRRIAMVPAESRVRAVLATVFYDASVVHRDRFAVEVDQTRRRDRLDYADQALIGAARMLTAEAIRPAARSLWHDAELVRVPVLAIYGSHDRLVNPKMAARAARAFPDVRVLVLPRTGHVAMMEHPAQVAAHFREMVKNAGAHRGMPGAEAELTPVSDP